MKYTKSALGLLNAQYKSVLKKCLLINLGLFIFTTNANASVVAKYDGAGTAPSNRQYLYVETGGLANQYTLLTTADLSGYTATATLLGDADTPGSIAKAIGGTTGQSLAQAIAGLAPVQSVAEGATNGTIAVNGTDVKVHGLGTAAYVATATSPIAAASTDTSLVSAAQVATFVEGKGYQTASDVTTAVGTALSSGITKSVADADATALTVTAERTGSGASSHTFAVTSAGVTVDGSKVITAADVTSTLSTATAGQVADAAAVNTALGLKADASVIGDVDFSDETGTGVLPSGNTTTVRGALDTLDTAITGKQDKLTATSGGGITIDGSNNISVDSSVYKVKDVGTGLTNSSGTISVDTSVVQGKLTATSGGGITIDGSNNISVDSGVYKVKTVAEGATNGTIAVNGTDVKVHGLGTAAYATIQDTLASASAGQVADAKAVNDALDTKADASVVGKQATAWGTGSPLAGKTFNSGAATDTTVAGALDALNTAAKTSADANTTQTTALNTLAGVISNGTYSDSAGYAAGTGGLVKDVADTKALLGTASAAMTTGILNGKTISGAGNTNDVTVTAALKTVAESAAGTALDNTFTGANTFSNKVTANGGADVKGNLKLINSTDASKNATLSVDANGAISTGNANINAGTGTVTATALNAGANGTALSNGQLVLNNGTNPATTLTANANGLVVDTGLTAGGGKFQVDGSGKIQDVRGIIIADGTDGSKKIGMSVDNSTGAFSIGKSDGSAQYLTVGADGSADIAGGLTAGTGDAFTVSAAGAITKAASITSDGALTVKAGGADITGNSVVKGTFGAGTNGTEFTVDGSGNTVAAGTVKIGGTSGAKLTGTATDLTSDKKVVSANGFEVDANTSLTATNGLKVGDGTNNSSLTKTQLTVDGGSTLTKTDLTTTTVNATTVNAGTNGTALTDNSLVLNGGSSKVATLTGTTSGLNVAEGLTVATNKFTVNGTNGNTTVGGTLKVGGANAITGTANTLAMGSNSLTGIADIASTSLTTSASGKTVAIGGTGYTTTVTGNEVVTGTVQIGGTSGAKLTGTATDLTSDKKVISSNGFEVNNSNSLTNGALKLAGTTVNSIDNSTGIARNTAGVNTALATTSVVVGTIKNQAEDATYSNTVTSGSNITTTTINGALANLDTSIGNRSTLSATNGNLTSGATVVASLNALDTTLGNVHALDGTTGTQTGNLAPANSSVAAHLAAIDDRLGQITGLYDGSTVHSTNVTSTVNGNSNLMNGSTVEDHLVSLDNSVGDRTLASSNTAINTAMSGTSMAAGLQAAGNAIGDMNFASTRYVSGDTDLSSAVRTLDSNMARIDNEVRDLRHDFNSGMAQLSAMSALVPNPRAAGDTSLSLGTGAYNGHTAMAFGGFHYITDNILLNAGASWGNSNDMSYRLGVTWSF